MGRTECLMFAHTVTNQDELREIRQLTFNAYLEKSYINITSRIDELFHPELDTITDTTIFYIRGKRNNIIGTVSITIDNTNGLPSDTTFLEQTKLIRERCNFEGLRLACIWRLISLQENHACVVGSLIDAIQQSLKDSKIDITLATLNPDHEKFYKRIGFKTIARTKNEEGLINAPSVLMLLESKNIKDWDSLRQWFFCD